MKQSASRYFLRNVSFFHCFIALCSHLYAEWSIISKTLDQHAINNAEETATRPAQKPPRILPPVPQAKFSPPPRKAQPQSPSIPPARPIIKLKMSAQSVLADPKPVASSSKPRKVKAKHVGPAPVTPPLPPSVSIEQDVDAPPPPYIDDGSHDLLQEVLAIEREKSEMKRQQSLLKSQERLVTGSSSKRKHVESSAEDDILALATPAKKEKSMPSASTSSNGKLVLPATKPKPKKDASAPYTGTSSSRSNSARSTPAIDIPRPSLKGKEKDISLPPASATTAPSLKFKKTPIVHATPLNEKKCREILKILGKIPDSAIFQVPVDPDRDGCPTSVLRRVIYVIFLVVLQVL